MSFKGEEWELYNVAGDRTELSNLAKAEPERLNAMVAKWKDMSLNVLHSRKLSGATMKPAKSPRTNRQWTVFRDSVEPSVKTPAATAAETSKGEKQFARRDKDKDGKVSYQEFIIRADRDSEKMKAMFNRKDADKDGFLTIEDYVK